MNSEMLPGFDITTHPDDAAFRASLERMEIESSLATSKQDISRTSGEMERNSPLFGGSDASDQPSLFTQF
jgi:hypothetical protein